MVNRRSRRGQRWGLPLMTRVRVIVEFDAEDSAPRALVDYIAENGIRNGENVSAWWEHVTMPAVQS